MTPTKTLTDTRRMKILHTSDWHLGHRLYGHDRTEEQTAMTDRIAEIAREEKPDVFLLCGDVYDVAQPSAAVQTMFVSALVKIQQAHPEMKIIVTAGNHDSGSRHEVFRIPWKALGVEMIGTLSLESPELHIVEIPGKGYIIGLPYANERYIPEGFIQRLLDSVQERNRENLPIVMTAHTTLRGADYKGHEETGEHIVGGIEGIDIAMMGRGYDYLALGHIHHDQFVHTGRHNVRYSGSPLAVSFDEDFPHSVSIVTIDSHGSRPEVRKVAIENPWPLVTLPSSGAADWERAMELLADFPEKQKAYIRLNIHSDDILPPGAVEEAVHVIKGKLCKFCGINQKRKFGDHREKIFTVKEFKALDPLDIARQFVEEEGKTFDEDIKEMLGEVMEAIKEEDDA